jgi:(p)ppGpp synthase/HD superfamily hydrolase
LALACASHRGQMDKAGQPYILHPLRLMLGFESMSEQIVAVLHDVVEDSLITLERLLELGFDPSVVNAIDALTRRQGERDSVHCCAPHEVVSPLGAQHAAANPSMKTAARSAMIVAGVSRHRVMDGMRQPGADRTRTRHEHVT